MSKGFPDLSVCNTVMPGKKYTMWNGSVNLECPESGYCASLKAEEKHGKINALSGTVYNKDDPSKIVYKLEGVCGQETRYWSPDSPNDTMVLIDLSSLEEAYLQYLPGHLRTELDSIRLWVPVANAIITNNMDDADAEKKKSKLTNAYVITKNLILERKTKEHISRKIQMVIGHLRITFP